MKKRLLILLLLLMTGFMIACKSNKNNNKTPVNSNQTESSDTKSKEEESKAPANEEEQTHSNNTPSEETLYTPSALKIVTIKGPTGISISPMAPKLGVNLSIENNIEGVLTKFKKNEGDIFLIPSNLYAKLKNSGVDIKLLHSNVGVALNFLTMDSEFKEFKQIEGRTIALTGRGAIPEIVLNKLLESNAIDPAKVTIQWISEPSEIAGIIKKDPKALLLLPEPLASTMMTKNSKLISPFKFNEVWQENNLPDIITSVIVTTNAIYDEKKNDIIKFIHNYITTLDEAKNKKADFSKAIASVGITSEEIALKALDSIEFVNLTGKALYDKLDDFFEIILENNPELIGGKLPDHAS